MARVSVIIPAYNVVAFIEEAVRSALEQTFEDIEVIVVNDGSTDGTLQVLESLPIHRIDQENRGLAAAKNAGIRQASGRFIAFLDGDDRWQPDLIERGLERLAASKTADVVVFDARLIDETGHPTGNTYYGKRSRSLRFRDQDQARWIVQYNFILGFAICGAELLEKHGGFDEELRTFEDWDFWMRALLGNATAALIPEPLGHYRMRLGSLTGHERQLAADEVRLLEKAVAHSASPVGTQARLNYARAKEALLANDSKRAAAFFASALTGAGLPARYRARAALGAAAPGLAAHLRRG